MLLLGQLSVRATIGGMALVVDPSGTLVGLSAEPFDSTPVGTFLVPGLVLLFLYGLLSAFVCLGLYARRPWARQAAIAVALALLLWVLLELAIGFSRPPVYLNIGTAVGIVGVALHPAVRSELREPTG